MKDRLFSILSKIFAPILSRTLPEKYLKTLKDKSIVWGYTNEKKSMSEKVMMRLMKPYFLKEFYSKSDQDSRKANREQYWGSLAGKLWHEEVRKQISTSETFANNYFSRREAITAMIGDFINQFGGKFDTICEIGTGNGLYLNYLHENNSQWFRRWVGIDLSAEQIEINKKVYEKIPIEFISMEISNWIKTDLRTGTLFLTAGTLECFTEIELVEFYKLVKEQNQDTAIALMEPISFDLSTNKKSAPRGLYMYSHNYPLHLTNSGFTIYQSISLPAEPENPENKNQLLSIIAYSQKK